MSYFVLTNLIDITIRLVLACGSLLIICSLVFMHCDDYEETKTSKITFYTFAVCLCVGSLLALSLFPLTVYRANITDSCPSCTHEYKVHDVAGEKTMKFCSECGFDLRLCVDTENIKD